MKHLWILTLLSLVVVGVNAQSTTQRTKHYNLEDKVGIQGYDPVAYFVKKKAVKGSKTYKFIYKGIPYRFSSQSNLNLFKANPSKYEPQYGGWCAYAMGKKGAKVSIDPERFKIKNGKLYLFYYSYFNDTLEKRNENEINLKKKADASWIKTIKS